MDPNTLKAIQGAAGAASGDKIYVEDVFSTHLYKGTGSAFAVNNGIDLAGEGGVVWGKPRNNSASENGQWVDTVRFVDADPGGYDVSGALVVENNAQASGSTIDITDFTSTGFNIGATTGEWNKDSRDYVSWTFRKATGFFDIVTFEGNFEEGGSQTQTLAHNLGSVPGMMLIKKTSDTGNWYVYHKSRGNTKHLVLNTDAAEVTSSTAWNSTSPTATHFTVGPTANTNEDNEDYVAYLFADGDDTACKIFGESGDQAVVKVGEYTGNATSGHEIPIGFEPQWIMVKDTSSGTTWQMFDNMRGMSDVTDGRRLYANDGTAEGGYMIAFYNDGLHLAEAGGINSSGQEYIYIAIRRGPMKTPEDATKVFTAIASDTPTTDAQRPEKVDMYWFTKRGGFGDNLQVADRVRGFQSTSAIGDDNHTSPTLVTQSANNEFTSGSAIAMTNANSNGPLVTAASSGSSFMNYIFKRAPGFFDIVCYTGTHPTVQTIKHSLGVVPEMMIHKARTSAMSENWAVYHKDLTDANYYLQLNTNDDENSNSGMWNATDPTASVFTVGNDNQTNYNGGTFVAYLFATLAGVSKVGTYEGTGSAFNIDCGFTGSARFILIKNRTSDGNWMLYDSARGINSGDNDPYLRTNLTSAETTDEDHINPHTGGFGVTTHADVNTDNEHYIYLAIA